MRRRERKIPILNKLYKKLLNKVKNGFFIQLQQLLSTLYLFTGFLGTKIPTKNTL